MRLGAKGHAVEWFQQQLVAHGFDPGEVDGVYGISTQEALRAFQRTYGLRADSTVGPRTRRLLAKDSLPQTVKMVRIQEGGSVERVAERLGVSPENLVTTASVPGGRIFPGEPVLYSLRKVWVRKAGLATYARRTPGPGGSERHLSGLVGPLQSSPRHGTGIGSPSGYSVVIPVATAAGRKIEFAPTHSGSGVYVSLTGLIPDLSGGQGGHGIGPISERADTAERTEPQDLVSAAHRLLHDRVLAKCVMLALEDSLRLLDARGVSVDIGGLDLVDGPALRRLLKRIRSSIGKSRLLIVSVPGEAFDHKSVGATRYRSLVAGFALDAIASEADVVIVRCWRDPAISEIGEQSLAPIGWVRRILRRATKTVPPYLLAAGILCGGAVDGQMVAADQFPEIERRYIVRRKHDPDEGATRAVYSAGGQRKLAWLEDDYALDRKLDLVNRYNLLGVEFFWPGASEEVAVAQAQRHFELLDW